MVSPLLALKCQYHSLFFGDLQISYFDSRVLITLFYQARMPPASPFRDLSRASWKRQGWLDFVQNPPLRSNLDGVAGDQFFEHGLEFLHREPLAEMRVKVGQ